MTETYQECEQKLKRCPINATYQVRLFGNRYFSKLNRTPNTQTVHLQKNSLIARFMGPIWGPSGADRTQVGPMLAPWTLLSGQVMECTKTHARLIIPDFTYMHKNNAHPNIYIYTYTYSVNRFGRTILHIFSVLRIHVPKFEDSMMTL